MKCNDIYIRRIEYNGETIHAVLGLYSELELTIFKDGSVRIDYCNMLMLNELLKAVKCIKKIASDYNIKI